MKLDPRDIRLWLGFFFVLRLYGITNPPLETSHHWRQATVAMVARNLVEDDFDVFHPRMDTAGELTGITGMEFPLLNLLIAIVIALFGPEHWYGRLIVLVVSTIGVHSFYRLVQRAMNGRVAFYASLLLSVSLWFMYSRKIMPDVFALSWVIMGLERLDKFTRTKASYGFLVWGCTLVALGTLSKITAGCLLVTLPVLVWPIRSQPKKVGLVAGGVLLACMPTFWWYFTWVPWLVERYGYWHFFMGKPVSSGWTELISNLPRTLDNFYFDALRFSGFAAFLLGYYFMVRNRMNGLMACTFLVSGAFLLVMLRSGDTFWIHAYYVLPFVPMMALIGGVGLATLNNQKIAALFTVLIAIEGIASQYNDFNIPQSNEYMLSLEREMDALCPSNELVIINSGDVPTPMYFAHRRGWTVSNEVIKSPSALDSLRVLGGSCIIALDHIKPDSLASWHTVLSVEAYCILVDSSHFEH